MKIFEVISDRIPTGVRKTTVANPAKLQGKDFKVFEGDPDEYHFTKIQKQHYIKLKEILYKIGQDFNYIGAATYPADRNYMGNAGTLTRFVVVSPVLVWEKYEGRTPGGGQNYIYAGGQKEKLSIFLQLPFVKQVKLLLQNQVSVNKKIITQLKLRYPEEFADD